MSITDNFTYLSDLLGEHKDAPGEGRAVPDVKKLADLDGARIIRLAFRDGDVMADHHAPAPIIVVGQEGTVDFTIGSKDDAETSTVQLTHGSAVHVAAGQVHSLTAKSAAQVTLILLTGAQPTQFLPNPSA